MGRPPGGPKTGGRKKGSLNKATMARELVRLYTSEAIEALRSVCADSSADETARVQAACKLLDLLPSQLLLTKEALSAEISTDGPLHHHADQDRRCDEPSVAGGGVP